MQNDPGADEFLLVVDLDDGRLVAHGSVTRRLAHSGYRIPHTTVLLVPAFADSTDVLICRRPDKDIGSRKWDFAGGHVAFDLAALDGPDALLSCIERTAIRETREEILATVDGDRYVFGNQDLHRFSEPGELVADEPTNREFSTGFIVTIPANADAEIVDEQRDGTVVRLETQRLPIRDVDAMFRSNPDQFADGAARVLAWRLSEKWPL